MKGTLVIVGGGLRYDNHIIFDKMVELASGKGKARIAIIPSASNHPYIYGSLAVDAFKSYGADAELIPIGNCEELRNYETAAYNQKLIDKILNSTGVYFIGGIQERIPQSLYNQPDGMKTPMLNAIWDVYERGGFIGGTSAGAAIMSEIMFKGGDSIDIMKNGAVNTGSIGYGLGFIGKDVLVDQHFFAKGRFGRCLKVMTETGYQLGLGIAENTAGVVTHGEEVEIIGYKGALIMDLTESTIDETLDGFNLQNGIVTYLDRGDRYNIRNRKTTPSHYKLNGIKIDPTAEDFVPYNTRERFYNDILANRVLRDMMWDFIDNNQKEAIGLAFSNNLSDMEKRKGFEFKFYKTKKSIGYYTGILGSEDYTVIDIHFNITPIYMPKRLYEYIEKPKVKLNSLTNRTDNISFFQRLKSEEDVKAGLAG